MNGLDQIEAWLGWAGFAGLLAVLGNLALGVARGVRRQVGQTAGHAAGLLRSPVFYLHGSLVFFGFCWLMWRPLPFSLSGWARIPAMTAGSLLFFSGLGLVLWGRMALGRQYFVSTGMGAQLFAGHRLVTGGPFALIRHPMYVGLIMTSFGGLLLYRTWTFTVLAVCFFGLVLRARREEEVLRAAFGAEWLDYCRRVPGWIPRLTFFTSKSPSHHEHSLHHRDPRY